MDQQDSFVAQMNEFCIKHPDFNDFVTRIIAAHALHCHKRVTVEEAYQHVAKCEQCQEYVDVGRRDRNKHLEHLPEKQTPPFTYTK